MATNSSFRFDDVARYKDGLRVATTLFEAAAWHYAIKPICGRCRHSRTFNPHGLWWHFQCKGWSDDLRDARTHLWCRDCGQAIGKRIRPRVLELVAETDADICLLMPPATEWKRAVNRFRS